MGTAPRPAAPALDDQLFASGEQFSYFQAIRLLRRYARQHNWPVDAVRVRPRLALVFPETDIDRIERVQTAPAQRVTREGSAPSGTEPQPPRSDSSASDPAAHLPASREVLRLTANFFGLYGVASPLPSFYTEDLMNEAREGRQASRAFLDILHAVLYPLLFDGWLKYRPSLRVVEERDERQIDQLYAFVGLENRVLRQSAPPGAEILLRYSGLLSQRPRSALGLKAMLADVFAPARVDIEGYSLGLLPIPEDQRTALGDCRHALGVECYLGTLFQDRENHLQIRLNELPDETFHALLTGGDAHQRLRFLVRFYLTDPLKVMVNIRLMPGQAQSARLGGGRWNRLGLNTWLAPVDCVAPAPVRYEI